MKRKSLSENENLGDEIFSSVNLFFAVMERKVSVFLDMCRLFTIKFYKNCISIYFAIRFKLKQRIAFIWEEKLELRSKMCFSLQSERIRCMKSSQMCLQSFERLENAQIFSVLSIEFLLACTYEIENCALKFILIAKTVE